MTLKIVGLCGFAGAGKDTFARVLEREWKKTHGAGSVITTAFASMLKDAAAFVFDFPRDSLEGASEQARAWRELPDMFWSKKFGEDITPRICLQRIGDALRGGLHKDIVIWALEARLANIAQLQADTGYDKPDTLVIITDVRFRNEINMIQGMGGQMVQICRDAVVPQDTANLHISEKDWWADPELDKDRIFVINNTTVDDLQSAAVVVIDAICNKFPTED